VLVRDWGGVTHQAQVLEDGILFRSKRYKSLSRWPRHHRLALVGTAILRPQIR